MQRICVGVDAGGSRTVAIAARGESELRTASGEGANPRVLGVDRAAAAIARVVEDALAGDAAAALFVGAAGAGRDATARGLRDALAERFPGARVECSDDAHIALRAAIPHGDGIVLIAGTGSIALAQIGAARWRAGGYGYALGDEGSGYAIGSAALKLLMRAYDGRAPRDPLLDALAARLGAESADDVVARVYESATPVAEIASYAPLVLEFANAGERSAHKIVQAAALELFDLLRAVIRRADCAQRELPLAFAGGLLSENSLLTYLVETRVNNDFPLLSIVKGAPEPHHGALAEARALLAKL